MPLEINKIDSVCNAIRRQIEHEYKDIDLFFLPHTTGKAAESLHAKRHIFKDYDTPTGFFTFLGRVAEKGEDKSHLVCFSQAISSSFLSFSKRNRYTFAIFINADEFEDTTEARISLYHIMWHTLRARQYLEEQNEDHLHYSHNIIQLNYKRTRDAHENMMADAFAAIMMEMTLKKGHLPKIARIRSLSTLQPKVGYKAERYPFPIAIESCEIVYKELFNATLKRNAPIAHALDMSEEVGYTFAHNVINQWRSFARAAQEMAWMGFDKNQILGSAIFSSEDPYIRSMAYLLAETLFLEPGPTTHLQSHNPFANDETNERIHQKACNKSFSAILSLAEEAAFKNMKTDKLFLDQARMQNAQLLKGNIIGWCAHSLIEAEDAFSEIMLSQRVFADKDVTQNLESPRKIARRTYDRAQKNVPWSALLKLSRQIMVHKRRGNTIDLALILSLCKEYKDMRAIAQAFKKAPPEQ